MTMATDVMTPRPSDIETPGERVVIFTVDPQKAQAPATGSTHGLEQMLAYLEDHRGSTSLTQMCSASERAKDGTGKWQFDRAETTTVPAMSGLYFLRTKSVDDSIRFQKTLKADDRVKDAHRPPPYRARTAVPPAPPSAARTLKQRDTAIDKLVAAANADKQWGLTRCGFPEVRSALEVGKSPGPIGMIDIGNHWHHPEIASRIVRYFGPTFGQDSIVDHAGSVAAIVSALRDGQGAVEGEDMDGCCSADIVLHNVWTRNDGLDQVALYQGIRYAIEHKLPVLNISVWTDTEDLVMADLVAQCANNGVVVVAAMGNAGTSGIKFYPAADTGENVIAVAATNPADERHYQSSTGKHVWIAAPGENIFTVIGDTSYDRVSGTSFAAPFVSAAVWLAKHRRPELTFAQVKELLKRSVADPVKPWNNEVGFGRLDMKKLVEELPNV